MGLGRINTQGRVEDNFMHKLIALKRSLTSLGSRGQGMRAMTFFRTFLQDDSGATAIEYSLIAAGIGLTIIPVLGDVNSGVLSIYGIVTGLFPQVM